MKPINYFIVPENGQYKLYFPVELEANETKTFRIEKDKAFKPDISIFEDFRLNSLPKYVHRPTIIRGTITVPEDDSDTEIFVLRAGYGFYFKLYKSENDLHYDFIVDIGLDDRYEDDYGTLRTNDEKELIYQITITGSSIDLLLSTKDGRYLDSDIIYISNFQKVLLAYALRTKCFEDIEDLCFDEILYALPYNYYKSHIHEDFRVYQVPDSLPYEVVEIFDTTGIYVKNTFAKPIKGFVAVENLNDIIDNPSIGLRIFY